MYWDAFGGSRVLFARLFDVHTLDQSRLRSLLCVLGQLSGGHGEWSAPGTSGKSFVSNASSVSRCHFAQGSQLAANAAAEIATRQIAERWTSTTLSSAPGSRGSGCTRSVGPTPATH